MYITENDINLSAAEPYVEIMLKEGDTPWTGGINGKFYRISRGKPVKVPKCLAKLIFLNEQVTVLSQSHVADYKKGSGKCLGGKKK